MRLMVIGHARHGKDSVCDILQKDYGLTFESSSHFVAKKAVEPYLRERGIIYPSFDAMYADRVNHREAWHTAIALYNQPDPTRLGRELYDTYNIYCGIRSEIELEALQAQKVIDYTIWVDASKRLPPEPKSSMKLTKEHADFIVDNNGPVEILPKMVALAMVAAALSKDPYLDDGRIAA